MYEPAAPHFAPLGAAGSTGLLGATIVPCPWPVISYASTTALPLASLKTLCGKPSTCSVTAGVWLAPRTCVHCLTSSPSEWKFTVPSAVPCQIDTRGRGPVNVGEALC